MRTPSISIALLISFFVIQVHGDMSGESRLRRAHTRSHDGTHASAEVRGSDPLGPCKTCIYVIERMKQGYQYLLPSICVEIFTGNQDKGDFGQCQEALANLSVNGANVKGWLNNGCFKTEDYGAMELIQPCPAHVICAEMKDLLGTPFCEAPGSDFTGKPGKKSSF